MSSEGSQTRHKLVRIAADTSELPRIKPRILFVSAAAEVGGAERSLLELLAALSRESYTLSVSCPPDGSLSRAVQALGLAIYPIAFRRFRRTTNVLHLAGQVRALYHGSSQLAQLCKDQRVDLLHANTDSAALIAWEAARQSKTRFIWHCRDMRPLHGLARVLSGSASTVIAISAAVGQHLEREGVRPAKIARIDNGIDLARFDPAHHETLRTQTRAQLGLTADIPVLLDIGAFVPWKRHELYIEALAHVRARLPRTVGLLAGSDQFGENSGYAAQLKTLARRLNIPDEALLFLSQREDVPGLLAAADLLVSPSDSEPFGRVLAEAGAAGLPVVTTRSGGKAEIVEDNVTGCLVEPGNARALADRCLHLLADSRTRQTMAELARMRIARLFDVRRTAREVSALYSALLAGKPDAAEGPERA